MRKLKPGNNKIKKPAEMLYRTIFETTGTATIIVEDDMTISMANKECEKLLGYSREEIVGIKKWDALIADEEADRLKEYHRLRRINPDAVPKNYETKLVDKTNNFKYVSITADLIPGTKKSIVSILDITRHKCAEDALRESEERYRILIETSPDAVVLMDLNTNIIMVNPAALRLFGFESDKEVIGKSGLNFVSPEDVLSALTDRKELLEGGNFRVAEYTMKKRGGFLFPCELKGGLIKDAEGNPKAIITVIRDVTERKHAGEALRTSEEKYRTLVENVNIGIYRNTGGPHGQFLQANPTIVKMFGYDSVREFMNVSTSELYQDPEERKIFVEKMQKQGFVKDEKLKLRKKDGTFFWGSVTAKAQRDDDGEIRWIDGVIEDITERKRIEERLVQSLEALQSVYKIATTMRDSYGAVCDQVTYSLSNLLKVSYVAVQHVKEDRLKIISRIKDGEITHGGEISLEHSPCAAIASAKDEPCQIRGSLVDLFPENELIASNKFKTHIGVPIKGIGGEVAGLICVMDYRNRTFTEDEIRLIEIFARYVAYEYERDIMEAQLRYLDRMRLLGQMAAGVAHEVRNPLNAILAITEALFQDIGDKPEYKPFLEHIRTQVNRLSRLMGDLLDLGKPIQASSLRRESLATVIVAAMDLWRQASLSRTHRVQLIMPSEQVDLDVMADNSRLQQVFLNLLENAAQHSPEGSEIQFIISAPKKTTARVRVIDQGTGVQPENLSKIFEPFFTTRKRGNGLGLSIVKNTIEALGGDIVIQNNRPAPGCTVEITLPIIHGDRL